MSGEAAGRMDPCGRSTRSAAAWDQSGMSGRGAACASGAALSARRGGGLRLIRAPVSPCGEAARLRLPPAVRPRDGGASACRRGRRKAPAGKEGESKGVSCPTRGRLEVVHDATGSRAEVVHKATELRAEVVHDATEYGAGEGETGREG